VSEVTQRLAVARAPAGRLVALGRAYGTTVAVATIVFLIALDDGGYGESTRDTLGVALWWVLVLALALGIWPLVRTPVAALATGGLITAFALFTLLSVTSASNAAAAYTEFTRVALYLGVFAVTVVASRKENAGRWCDGLALGIAAVMTLSLISRLFPGTFGEQEQTAQLLSAVKTRLNYPVGYWNGLAILTALGIPLLLRIAVVGSSAFVRGLAVAALPATPVLLYLTSSRTGVAASFIAAVAFVALTARRWAALAAAGVAALGSVAALLVLADRDALVNGPVDGLLATSQGHSAALIIGAICAVAGVVYGAGCMVKWPPRRVSPALGWVVCAAFVALAAVGVASAHPVRRFHEFKQLPSGTGSDQLIQSHLASGSGNGRWQLWASAIDEFQTQPLHGRGAGSFNSWWLQHGSLRVFVQDAHSLYAETLGELGIIGFLLLVALLAGGLGVGVRRLLASEGTERVTLAAVVATMVAYCVAAGVDWMWELTIVSVVAFVCLGLATGPATALAVRPRVAEPDEPPRRGRYALGVCVIVGGWLLICAIAIALLGNAKLQASQDAFARGDIRAAAHDASTARSIQPWSPIAYRQLALVSEDVDDYAAARRWIGKAIDRAPQDWQLWYIAARIETKQGAIRAAARSLARAKTLNPRSELFRSS